MKRLLALPLSVLTALTVVLMPSASASTPDLNHQAAAVGNCSIPGFTCGRIRNSDPQDRFRITYAWGGNGSTDRDLYPNQRSWDYGPDADGFRIGRCWRAHLWKHDGGIRYDYGYKYGPPAGSSAGWTWFKVTDNPGVPALAYHWEVNGLVWVC